MTIITIAGVVLCCWMFLSILGGERQRQIRDFEAQAAQPAEADEVEAKTPAGSPTAKH